MEAAAYAYFVLLVTVVLKRQGQTDCLLPPDGELKG
jgi:hypothetical protein